MNKRVHLKNNRIYCFRISKYNLLRLTTQRKLGKKYTIIILSKNKSTFYNRNSINKTFESIYHAFIHTKLTIHGFRKIYIFRYIVWKHVYMLSKYNLCLKEHIYDSFSVHSKKSLNPKYSKYRTRFVNIELFKFLQTINDCYRIK